MIKKISELNKTVHQDGDYVVIFDDGNIANSFGVNLDSAHVCTIENGELKLKDFEPAKYDEVQSVEYVQVDEAAQETVVENAQVSTQNVITDKVEATTETKKTLFDKVFGKIKS